mmetsp:Transcript_28651/g.25359  ORF Transcript_28651/g.25359 Transcript_28651/m.25359 type:complete len:144 (+) Transcript_28651:1097-1528(+)
MDHVKDELQLFIKKNLKIANVNQGGQKSFISDCSFMRVEENMDKYNDIIDKIVDFNELFKCSINHIVDVWKEKLGHIERLYEIFEYRHKKLFTVNIWQDKEIVEVIKLFLAESSDEPEYRKRVEELKHIDDELTDCVQGNTIL